MNIQYHQRIHADGDRNFVTILNFALVSTHGASSTKAQKRVSLLNAHAVWYVMLCLSSFSYPAAKQAYFVFDRPRPRNAYRQHNFKAKRITLSKRENEH